MANFSFDIVSEVDMQEVDNAINQAKKEMSQRYDFKNSKSYIEFNRKEKIITLVADDDFKRRAIVDILAAKMAKRRISLKSLRFDDPQQAFEGNVRQKIDVVCGIDQEKAKDLVKIIKGLNLKVQTQIEGEKIKVSSAKKDDLQSVIAHLRDIDFSLPLNFCNYR